MSKTQLDYGQSARFRADIEGLRAFAVIAVLVFHLNAEWLPGGFVGVDVFLVISGFIITRQLMGANARGTFSVVDFWVRRIRRLYPAMLTVIVLTMAVGFYLMSGAVYKETAESGLAAIFMGANIFFADRVGYFAAAAETRPLLHFWSLSFEQQFYLLIPLLFIWKQPPVRLVWILTAVILASFITGLVMVDSDPDRAFYLPFGRFWEIAIGALVAVLAAIGLFKNLKGAPLLAGAGLATILFSFGFIRADAVFPDLTALLPTLATAAVIIAGEKPHLFQSLLTNPVMRWHGRLSYTLYLVHWPVIVFFDMIQPEADILFRLPLVLALTYALTIAIHHLIEMPMRHGWQGKSAKGHKFVALLCAAALPATYIALSSGAIWRLPERAQLIETYKQREPQIDRPQGCETIKSNRNFGKGDFCKLTASSNRSDAKGSFVLVGDSHMGMLAWETADHLYKNGFKQGYILRVPTGCPAFYDVKITGETRKRTCGPATKALFEELKERKPTEVIFASRWASFGSPIKAPSDNKKPALMAVNDKSSKPLTFQQALNRTLGFLEPLSVTLVGPVPEQDFDVPSRMVTAQVLGQTLTPMTRRRFEQRQETVLEAFENAKDKVRIVYPHQILCGADTCRYAADTTPFYYDDDHLTRTGVMEILPIFDALIVTQ